MDDSNPLPLQAPLYTPVESLENFIGLQKLALKIAKKKPKLNLHVQCMIRDLTKYSRPVNLDCQR